MNVFGERQHPEKYLPKIINYVLNKKTLTIHSNKNKTKAGSRFYIHAQDVADAIPESEEPDTLTEGLSRGISQFVFGFIGGSKALKTLGWANNASKGLNLTRSFVVGGLVDFKGIPTNGVFHRALADSEMTAKLWLRMLDDIADQYGISPSFSMMQGLSKQPKASVHRFLAG